MEEQPSEQQLKSETNSTRMLVSWEEYEGPLHCHSCDKLHENAHEWAVCQLETTGKVPFEAQGLKSAEFDLSASKILDKACKRLLKDWEMYEPRDLTATQPEDMYNTEQVASLQALLDEWQKNNKPRFYEPDENTIVVFENFAEEYEKGLGR